MKFNEFKTHFPQKISADLEKYVTDTVLLESRYLFVKTVAKEQFAYCTHCKKKHRTTKRLKHKQMDRAVCPHCKSKCQVRAAGISRKYMRDNAVLIWYQKSVKDPQAITARIMWVYRDYSGDFKDVTTMYNCHDMYLFRPGESTQYTSRNIKTKEVYSAFDRSFGYGSIKKFVSVKNIREAVRGTPFQYSTWEQYTGWTNPHYVSDMTEFFALAARYPCVEYLTKLGFESIVRAKLAKDRTYGAVNWNGKTIYSVLRVDKAELKEIQKSGQKMTPQALRTYQKARKIGLRMGIAESLIVADLEMPIFQDYVREFKKITTEKEIYKYILKQIRHEGNRYKVASTVLTDWRDYYKQCLELKIDVREEKNLFPNNLFTAHTKLTKRIKMKKDQGINEKIAQRLPTLEKYRFEYKGMILRPATSTMELFEEGRVLEHCVGSYSRDYADGMTDICLVRKASNPDEPFYTMEIKKGTVTQCRGHKNKGMTPEVREFVEKFISKKLTKKSRIKIQNRQEVAV